MNDDLTPAGLRRGSSSAQKLLTDSSSSADKVVLQGYISRWQRMLREAEAQEPVIVDEAGLDEWLEGQRESW